MNVGSKCHAFSMTSSLNLTQSQSLVRQGPLQVCAIPSLVECEVGFPGGVVVEKLPSNAGDTRDAGLIPGSGRTMEKEMAAHSSILAGNPMDRGAWPTAVHGTTKESDMTKEQRKLYRILRRGPCSVS